MFGDAAQLPNSKNHHLLNMRAETLGRHRERITKRLIELLQTLEPAQLNTLYTHLVPYVPEPVIKSVDSGHGVWVGEVRTCVTMFVRLTGVRHDTSDDVDAIHEITRLVQRKMYNYAGSTFFRLIVDDKGLTNLWAFGLKWSMNQNYALNAVLAALETHKALGEKQRSCAVGITYGRVFCGTVGGVQRCEYTLHGTQVNLAARLMSKAGDGVLCDDAVFKATRDVVDYAEPVQTTVKGKVEPITVHRALTLKSKANGIVKTIKLKRAASSSLVKRNATNNSDFNSPKPHSDTLPRRLEEVAQRSFKGAAALADGKLGIEGSNDVLDLLTGKFLAPELKARQSAVTQVPPPPSVFAKCFPMKGKAPSAKDKENAAPIVLIVPALGERR